jgi:hypothetical protein
VACFTPPAPPNPCNVVAQGYYILSTVLVIAQRRAPQWDAQCVGIRGSVHLHDQNMRGSPSIYLMESKLWIYSYLGMHVQACCFASCKPSPCCSEHIRALSLRALLHTAAA